MKTMEQKEMMVLEYLEGEMSPAQEQEFRTTMEKDPELAGLLAEYQAQERQLQAFFEAEGHKADAVPKPDLSKLAVAQAPRRQARWTVVMAAAAAIALLAGTGVVMYPGSEVDGIRASVVAMDGRPQFYAETTLRDITADGALPGSVEWLKTPAASYVAIALRDAGTKVEMKANSSLRLSQGDKDEQLELERGEVLVWARQADHPVSVSTPHFVARGTDGVFSVVRGLRGSEVSVVSGEVEVISAGARRRITNGETYSSTGSQPLDLAQRTAWSREQEQLAALLPPVSDALAPEPQVPVEVASLPEVAEEPTMVVKSGSAASAPSAATSRFLPGRTVAFVEIPSITAFLQDGTTLDQLVTSQRTEQMALSLTNSTAPTEEVLEKFRTQLREITADPEFHALLRSLSGPASFGVTEKGFLLVAEIRSDHSQVRHLIEERLDPFFEENGNSQERLRAEVVNNLLLLGIGGEDFDESLAAAEQFRSTSFGDGTFLADVRNEVSGSHLTVALNAEELVRRSVETHPYAAKGLRRFGLANMQSVVAATGFSDQAENRALRILFKGEREGMASWLDTPGPFASPQFFSPDTHLLAAARIKTPEHMMQQLFGWIREDSPTAAVPETVDELRLMKALADTLGNEIAIGLDNPVLPIPNVKLAIEVLDPIGFHNEMLSLMGALEQNAEGHKLEIEAVDYRGHLIVSFRYPGTFVPLSYSVIGDFAVFGPGAPFLRSTIDMVRDRSSIDREHAFLEALPAKSGSHASLLIYVGANAGFGDAGPLLSSYLSAQGAPDLVSNTVAAQNTTTTRRAPLVTYAVAGESRIDFFIEGVKGDMQMTGMVPTVAEWLRSE